MGIAEKAEIKLTRSRDDWLEARECFVQSFRNYPVYKQLIEDESKREDFLRAYLNANYDVTVAIDNGILIVVKVPVSTEEGEKDDNNNDKRCMKVVGGTLLLRPSESVWSDEDDELFYAAYERHGLAEISPTGFERLLRYEKWESEHIGRKLAQTGVRMWTGLFCAVRPDYASQGIGSAVYKVAAKLMVRNWMYESKKATNEAAQLALHRNPTRDFAQTEKEKKTPILRKFLRSLSTNSQQYSGFRHRTTSLVEKQVKEQAIENVKLAGVDSYNASPESPPLYLAISHSDRAAKFHTANGCQAVTRVPYYDDEGKLLFFTHVLMMNVFQSTQIDLCKRSFKSSQAPLTPLFPNALPSDRAQNVSVVA